MCVCVLCILCDEETTKHLKVMFFCDIRDNLDIFYSILFYFDWLDADKSLRHNIMITSQVSQGCIGQQINSF